MTNGVHEGKRSPLRVLIAEDNADAAGVLALLLQLWGHQVRVAHDGGAALDTARAFRPEVVLLDLGLPGLDGFAVAERVRREEGLRETRLVALTGCADEDSRRRALAAGCDHFLIKPVDPADVRAMLGSVRADRRASVPS